MRPASSASHGVSVAAGEAREPRVMACGGGAGEARHGGRCRRGLPLQVMPGMAALAGAARRPQVVHGVDSAAVGAARRPEAERSRSSSCHGGCASSGSGDLISFCKSIIGT